MYHCINHSLSKGFFTLSLDFLTFKTERLLLRGLDQGKKWRHLLLNALEKKILKLII